MPKIKAKQAPPMRETRGDLSRVFQRAAELHRQGESDQAERLYRAILATQPNHFGALYWCGMLYYRQGRNAEALRCFGAATKVQPADAAAWQSFGLVQATLGHPAEALASYDTALALKPDFFEALNNRGNALRDLGRSAEALVSYDRALGLNPDHAAVLSNRGNALMDLGRPAEALANYDRALAVSPNYVEALCNRSSALKQLGRLAEALASFDAVLAARPDHAEAFNYRGTVLRNLNRLEDALASFKAALAFKPGYAEALNNRANVLMELGRPAEALASYDTALTFRPDYVEALNNRAYVLTELGRPAEALASCDAALALKPDYAEALNNRGNALRDLKRPVEALTSFDAALALKPNYVEALSNRGIALVELGRPQDALASYDRALAVKPDYAEAYDNKGVLLAELGSFNDAMDAIERALKFAPRRVRSYYHLTLFKRMMPGDPRFQAMEELARDMPSLAEHEQIDLHFALGKAFADVEDHERSFQHLLNGSALKRKQTIYDETTTLEILERMRAVFTSERVQANEHRGDPSAVPVFIVGMPRSGTTLVEQILASHPGIFGAGEIGDFDHAIAGLDGAAGNALHSPEVVSSMSGEQFRQLGANYVDRVRGMAPEAVRIINKTPGNFRLAGLIHLALPNARIIHVRRDPVDTCLSCFSKRFVENLPYTYDLQELGRYYRAYEALMAHWRSVLPQNVMLDMQYEELLVDLEGQGRRIVKHCGLEWDARCLDFHRNKRPVRTASLTQVRQPIYTSSVGRWRSYERFLGPLLAELETARNDSVS
jgi:tetratricopeptide (TPR) repeat protein